MRTVVALLLFFVATPVRAQDAAALDKLVAESLKEMHNKAADLYNSGDPNGAYRMFQGGLIAVRPLLAHRADLQQLIDQRLQAADQQASVALRAKGLHETIEAVRTKLKPGAGPKPGAVASTPTPSLPQPTLIVPPNPPPGPALPVTPPASSPPAAVSDKLWKRLGGEENVNKIVGDFLKWAVNDEKVNFTRGNKYPLNDQKLADLKQKFVAYISDISGGPIVGTSTRSLAEVHKGMKITDAEFDALVRWLKTALEKNNVARADVEDVLRKVNATRKDIIGS